MGFSFLTLRHQTQTLDTRRRLWTRDIVLAGDSWPGGTGKKAHRINILFGREALGLVQRAGNYIQYDKGAAGFYADADCSWAQLVRNRTGTYF